MRAVSLAVGPGTGVLGRIGVGPLAVSPAELAYAEWLKLTTASKAFPMPRGGVGSCLSTYAAMERQWLEYADGGMIDLLLHSQNCLHGARFAVRHRKIVGKVLLVNGPFGGAYLAHRFRGLPCAIDMRPGSGFLEDLRVELKMGFKRFERGLHRNPDYHVPEFHFFGLKHDRVVQHGSPNPELGELAEHHCVGGGSCPPVGERYVWHEVEDDPNHLSVVVHRPSREIFRSILEEGRKRREGGRAAARSVPRVAASAA